MYAFFKLTHYIRFISGYNDYRNFKLVVNDDDILKYQQQLQRDLKMSMTSVGDKCRRSTTTATVVCCLNS